MLPSADPLTVLPCWPNFLRHISSIIQWFLPLAGWPFDGTHQLISPSSACQEVGWASWLRGDSGTWTPQVHLSSVLVWGIWIKEQPLSHFMTFLLWVKNGVLCFSDLRCLRMTSKTLLWIGTDSKNQGVKLAHGSSPHRHGAEQRSHGEYSLKFTWNDCAQSEPEISYHM